MFLSHILQSQRATADSWGPETPPRASRNSAHLGGSWLPYRNDYEIYLGLHRTTIQLSVDVVVSNVVMYSLYMNYKSDYRFHLVLEMCSDQNRTNHMSFSESGASHRCFENHIKNAVLWWFNVDTYYALKDVHFDSCCDSICFIYIRGQFTHSFGIPALMHKDAGHCSGQKWLAGNSAGWP